jgi:RNA polymerase sigma-70 factor (ECF subfamily)
MSAEMEGDTQGLILIARQGDLRAFNQVVVKYQDRLYNLAFRALCDEGAAAQAVQQAFVYAYQALQRSHWRGDSQNGAWRAWMYRWAVQACRRLLGQRPAAAPIRRANGAPDLSELPFDLRLVIALVDLEGLDYDETAAILEISPLKVKSRLARARQQLAAVRKQPP